MERKGECMEGVFLIWSGGASIRPEKPDLVDWELV
jgi:hypothetical protein